MQKYWKLFVVALLVVTTMALTSCGKDDKIDASRLVGSWKVGGSLGSLAETFAGSKTYLQFAADGTFVGVSVMPMAEEEGSGQEIELGHGTYSVSSNKLRGTVDGKTLELTIETLTDSKLKLSGDLGGEASALISMLGPSLELTRVPDAEVAPYIKR